MNSEELTVLTVKEVNEMKAAAVMEFINVQVGAFEAGFVESNQLTLYSLHRFGQLHVKDNYGIEIKPMSESWGDHIAETSRGDSEQEKIEAEPEHDCQKFFINGLDRASAIFETD